MKDKELLGGDLDDEQSMLKVFYYIGDGVILFISGSRHRAGLCKVIELNWMFMVRQWFAC